MAEKKRKTELDIEGISAPKVEAPPPKAAPKPPPPPPPAEEEPSEKASPSDKKKMILIFSSVAVLAVVLVVALMVKSRNSAKRTEAEMAAKQQEEAAKKQGEKAAASARKPTEKAAQDNNFTMEPFIFQYQSNGKERFIRLGLTFQLSNEEALAEAKENTPLLRRSVIFYMKTRDVKELLSEQTRKKILDEIRGNIDKSLKDGRAMAVFMDEFVVY